MRRVERISKLDMSIHKFGSNILRQNALRSSSHGCEDNKKMTVGETTYEDFDLCQLGLDRIL